MVVPAAAAAIFGVHEVPCVFVVGCFVSGMLTGKYSADDLPKGPRGLLFRQILPGIAPLLDTMRQIASGRKKTVSQVPPPPLFPAQHAARQSCGQALRHVALDSCD